MLLLFSATMFTCLLTLLVGVDLGAIKSDPNPEHRSELALDYANAALGSARTAYEDGDVAKMQESLDSAGEAVALVLESLDSSGKNPRNNKFYKRAELRLRDMTRRLEGLRERVGFEDRAAVEKLHEQVTDVHDKLLKSIMGKNK